MGNPKADHLWRRKHYGKPTQSTHEAVEEAIERSKLDKTSAWEDLTKKRLKP